MTRRRLIVGLGLAVALAGCDGGSGTSPTVPEGPETVVVESEALVPVREACHVQGTVLNMSDGVTFDVALRFQAFDASERLIATTRGNVTRLAPGERRAYNATGFAANDVGLIPCSRIARFERVQTIITPR